MLPESTPQGPAVRRAPFVLPSYPLAQSDASEAGAKRPESRPSEQQLLFERWLRPGTYHKG